MKLNVAVVGYGNLGRALADKLKNSEDFNLVGIYSKRDVAGTTHISKLGEKKIDLLFLCGGSKTDLESQGLKYINDYNIIESYDNHNRLKDYITKIDTLAKENKKVSLCSFGWDPGLFSYMRGLFDSLGFTPYTFWGKGLSQGHTQAIKNINGVIDGLQFTLPSKQKMQELKNGNDIKSDKSLHTRLCYIVCKKCDRENIKNQIVTMPDYFEEYETKVRFVTQKRLNELKDFAHQGTVMTKANTIAFSLKLKSNPDFTAGVMLAYARSVKTLIENKKYGAYTIFDLPLNMILPKDKFNYL